MLWKMSKDELISLINEEKPIKNKTIIDTKRLYSLRKEKGIGNRVFRDIQNLYRLAKKKDINDKVLIDIRTSYEFKEDYYKPITTGNAISSNYIEYERNGDKDKTLSIKDYLDEIKPYLNHMKNDHKTQGK